MEEDNVISLRSFRKKKDNNLAFKDAIFEFKEMLRKLTETIESTIGPGEDTEHFIEAAIQRNLKLQEFVNQWMEYLAETERQTQIDLDAITKLADETIEEMRKMTEDIIKEGEDLLKDIKKATDEIVVEITKEV